MASEGSGYKHDASDRKLDRAAEAANEAGEKTEKQQAAGPGHDPAEIRKHDDAGKDRLFEGRQQHDEAEKNSEKNRLEREAKRNRIDESSPQVPEALKGSPPAAK